MVQVPTEAELSDRIRSHLERKPGRIDVAQTWCGYIGALMEWGVIEPSVHDRLYALLPRVDQSASFEIALGEYADQHMDDDAPAEARVA